MGKLNFYAVDFGKCATALYLEFTKPDTREEIPETTLKAWDDGQMIHDEVILQYENDGMLRAKGTHLMYAEHHVNGETDCTIEYDGVDRVTELKSINHRDFMELLGPLFNHRLQLMFYLDRILPDGWGLLIYIDKKSKGKKGNLWPVRKVFRVQHERLEMTEQYKMLDELWMRIQDRKMPERRFTLCRECLDCLYKAYCKKIS